MASDQPPLSHRGWAAHERLGLDRLDRLPVLPSITTSAGLKEERQRRDRAPQPSAVGYTGWVTVHQAMGRPIRARRSSRPPPTAPSSYDTLRPWVWNRCRKTPTGRRFHLGM